MRRGPRILIIILCFAVVAAAGFYAVNAISDINSRKALREQILQKFRDANKNTLPVIGIQGNKGTTQNVAHYMVMVTDSAESIGIEIASLCDFYGIAYTLDKGNHEEVFPLLASLNFPKYSTNRKISAF